MITILKKRALHRTKIIEGQVRGLQKMIENEEYCMDILTQSLAIQKSLRSLSKLMLENHIRTHVISRISPDDENQVLNELLRLYELHDVRGA